MSRRLHAQAAAALLPFAAGALSLGLASCVVVSGCEWVGVTLVHKTLAPMNVAQVAGKAVDVETQNGAISVVKSGGSEIVVKATVHATDEARAAATTVKAERDSSGMLVVRVIWPDGKRLNSEGCDIEIETPDAEGVKLRSSNGRLTIKDLSGKADLETSNGRIEVQGHRGDVLAHTSNGAVEAKDISGTFAAKTSNGRVNADSVAGSVDARTSNGAIEVRLAPTSSGPATLQSSNGRITLKVGSSFAGSVRCTTSNGGISATVPMGVKESGGKHDRTYDFGGKGAPSTISTSNGSIEVIQESTKSAV